MDEIRLIQKMSYSAGGMVKAERGGSVIAVVIVRIINIPPRISDPTSFGYSGSCLVSIKP